MPIFVIAACRTSRLDSVIMRQRMLVPLIFIVLTVISSFISFAIILIALTLVYRSQIAVNRYAVDRIVCHKGVVVKLFGESLVLKPSEKIISRHDKIKSGIGISGIDNDALFIDISYAELDRFGVISVAAARQKTACGKRRKAQQDRDEKRRDQQAPVSSFHNALRKTFFCWIWVPNILFDT